MFRKEQRKPAEDVAQIKSVARRHLEQLYGEGNFDAADEVVARDFIDHDPAAVREVIGREGAKRDAMIYRRAFPDLQIAIEDQLAEGDKVATRWTARGTHRGEFMGVAATGKAVEFHAITISLVRDGEVLEDWSYWDIPGLMQQIGYMGAAPTGA